METGGVLIAKAAAASRRRDRITGLFEPSWDSHRDRRSLRLPTLRGLSPPHSPCPLAYCRCGPHPAQVSSTASDMNCHSLSLVRLGEAVRSFRPLG